MIDEIRKYPKVYENIHQSIFRDSGILKQVKLMLKRGDSTETILEFIQDCEVKNGINKKEK